MTSPVKLVGRTRLGRLAINGKSKMAEPGEESNFSRKNTAVTFRFYHLQWSLNVWKGCMFTYTSEIFSDPRRKKKVFVEQYLGLFLAELGIFCYFVPGLLAIALSSRLPLFIWIAGIGLGTRLDRAVILDARTKCPWLGAPTPRSFCTLPSFAHITSTIARKNRGL